MECCLCHEVVHPGCVTDTGVEGYVKSELPNSWECPTCVRNGDAVKPEVKTEEDILGTGATPNKLIKLNNSAQQQPNKRAMAYGADSTYTGHQLFQVQGRPDQSKQELRSQLATQILSASTEVKREPQYVFRPPPMQLGAEEIYERRCVVSLKGCAIQPHDRHATLSKLFRSGTCHSAHNAFIMFNV